MRGVRINAVKNIALLAIAFVLPLSGCLSQRAARYAIRRGSAAVKSHAEARAAADAREGREDYRADARTMPLDPSETDRPELR